MPRILLPALLLALLLTGCPGAADPELPALQDSGAITPSADLFSTAVDGAAVDSGAQTADGAAPTQDAQGCALVPTGKYKGTLSGQGSGTIVFKVVAAQVGQTTSKGWFKLTSPKVQTYPVVLAGIHCYKMTAAIARPVGSTGGTDLRGSIRADYKAKNKLFRGDWTMPFGDGKFTATLQP